MSFFKYFNIHIYVDLFYREDKLDYLQHAEKWSQDIVRNEPTVNLYVNNFHTFLM